LSAVQEAVFRVAFPLPEVGFFNRGYYARSLAPGPRGGEAGAGAGERSLTYRLEAEPDGVAFDPTLNVYGFPGRDFSIAPPRDRPRVVFIGDSFVEGVGASDRDTIPDQFTRALGGPRRVDAINLGMMGASLADYVRVARDAVPLLRPDAV